eukprot:COSAG01_NODE_46124_length_402_cov_154.656766_1_plen_81_part_10
MPLTLSVWDPVLRLILLAACRFESGEKSQIIFDSLDDLGLLWGLLIAFVSELKEPLIPTLQQSDCLKLGRGLADLNDLQHR